MQIIGALIAGAFIGSILGLVGAGGAMLSVPILIYGFSFPPKQATIAALAIVFGAASAGVIPKAKKGAVLIKDAAIIWALGLVTNVGGTIIAKHLSDKFITLGFAVILISAGTSMLLKPITTRDERNRPIPLLILLSLLIGAMTGIFGVGGGFIAIPILVLYFHVSHEKASGTSLLIIALNCLTAFISHYPKWHEINWSIPIAMTISAIVVTHIASARSHKVPLAILRKAFAVMLYLIAAYTTLRSLT